MGYLQAAGVVTPDYPYATLVFVSTGYTFTAEGTRHAARKAPLYLS